MVVFVLSILIFGLTLDVSPPLAICASITGAVSVLLWMAFTQVSITGIPGIAGPPMPARIVLMVICLVLNINVVLHVLDGDVVALEWIKFGSLYTASVGVPHLIAFRHRSAGWAAMPPELM